MVQSQIDAENKTKIIFIILISLSALISISATILQNKLIKIIRRIAMQYMLKTMVDKFLHHKEMFKISNRILVNYNRRLDAGTWANVYSGKEEANYFTKYLV